MTTQAIHTDTRTITRSVMDTLKELRLELGVNQREMAERMGLKPSSVSDLEMRSIEPRLSSIESYARALGVNLTFSITDEEGNEWTT